MIAKTGVQVSRFVSAITKICDRAQGSCIVSVPYLSDRFRETLEQWDSCNDIHWHCQRSPFVVPSLEQITSPSMNSSIEIL